MKKVDVNSIDLNNSLFHFDVREESFIENNGFPPDIGPDSKRAEESAKVFFSRGIKGVLDIIDVWIIWRMNRDHYNEKDWTREFLKEEYLFDLEKQSITFNNMYEWLKKRKYYVVDLVEGIDYLNDDIDEAKKSAILDKKEKSNTGEMPWKFLFAKEMYKDKIEHFDDKVEDWNMHTITNHGISPDKIVLLETSDGKSDALSIVEELYQKYNSKEFRLLNSFMDFCKTKEKDKVSGKNL